MTSALRLSSDTDRLRALAAASDGHITLESTPTPAAPSALLRLHYPTAGNQRYPAERQREIRLKITLPERYPFHPPAAAVLSAIYHPNVYPSGVVCLGTKWLPSEGLDLFVQRLARLLTFDPLLVNTASPANREAAAWYDRARRRSRQAFPSAQPDFERSSASRRSRVSWKNLDDPGGRVLRACPACARKLRLPAGRSGTVRCPGCHHRFEVSS